MRSRRGQRDSSHSRSVGKISEETLKRKVPLFSMGVAIGRHGGRPENNRDKRKRNSYEEKTGFMYCYGNDADNDRMWTGERFTVRYGG